MSDVDVFVIDDDFDPLADLSLDDGERDDAEADYLPPIPDADKSVVPPVVDVYKRQGWRRPAPRR